VVSTVNRQINPGDLSELERAVILELRWLKRVDPAFPVTRQCLARKVRRGGKEVQAALSHLYENFHLVGPLVLDPRNIELTELGEELADQIDGQHE
jgi:hypothetical protein